MTPLSVIAAIVVALTVTGVADLHPFVFGAATGCVLVNSFQMWRAR